MIFAQSRQVFDFALAVQSFFVVAQIAANRAKRSGLLHRLQLGETLSCGGLSNFSNLTMKQIAGGVVDRRRFPHSPFWPENPLGASSR